MGLSLLETNLLQFLWFRKPIYVITLDSEEVLPMHMQLAQDGTGAGILHLRGYTYLYQNCHDYGTYNNKMALFSASLMMDRTIPAVQI